MSAEEPTAVVEPTVVVEPAVVEPAVVEPAVVEPAVVEPAVVEPAVVELSSVPEVANETTETVASIIESLAVDKVAEELAKEVLVKVSDKAPALISLIKVAMEIVEKKPVKGEQQRKLVIDALKICVENLADLSETTKQTYIELLQSGTISDMIDFVVAASKGKLDINKAKGCLVGCFSIFCGKK